MTTSSNFSQRRHKRLSLSTSFPMSSSSSSPSNPFHARWAATPMPGESEEQTAARVNLLQEAVKRSKEIDENLQEAKKVIDRRKKAVRILLLGAWLLIKKGASNSEMRLPGQSESGKVRF